MSNAENNEKKRKWIVTSAWPYVNATPHLGNLIGSVLSSDVFARYVRSKGDEVVFVSGSDEHGTPVAVSAIQQDMTPEELTKKNHTRIKKLFEDWMISYDNYTHTHNPVHIKFTQNFYKTVQDHGYVSTKKSKGYYCEKDKLFLPDRFIEGECPYCGSEHARGDQCDGCGRLLEPTEIIRPMCKICGNDPILKETKHWYLDFAKTEDKIREFVENNDLLPNNARKMSMNFLEEGLPSRAITRDLEWGIPAPFEGADEKTIYVWFEAVLGYISAVQQWAEEMKNDPEKFSYFWNDPESRPVYFIGKDNIIFHLIIFPGLIAAYNDGLPEDEKFVMPYNVSSTEFLNYENEKFSKSRKIGIWIDEALEIAPLEYWRYNLLRNRPEKQDSYFLWDQFEKDMLELNDAIGNFIHRTLTFIHRRYDAKVPKGPESSEIDDDDLKLRKVIKNAPSVVGELMEKFKLKAALEEVVNIAREGNKYLNQKKPWKVIKEDKQKAGYTFYHCMQLIRSLGILLEPFVPNVAEKIFEIVKLEKTKEDNLWDSASQLMVSQGLSISKPKPLFEKLDVKEIKEKLAKLHGHTYDEEFGEKAKQQRKDEEEKKEEIPEVSFEDFQKLEMRVGTILDVEPIPDASKLLKLLVDVGFDQPITLVAGLAKDYPSDRLMGTQIVVLVNLKPREMFGITSQGMLLAADFRDGAALLKPEKSVPNGSKIE